MLKGTFNLIALTWGFTDSTVFSKAMVAAESCDIYTRPTLLADAGLFFGSEAIDRRLWVRDSRTLPLDPWQSTPFGSMAITRAPQTDASDPELPKQPRHAKKTNTLKRQATPTDATGQYPQNREALTRASPRLTRTGSCTTPSRQHPQGQTRQCSPAWRRTRPSELPPK